MATKTIEISDPLVLNVLARITDLMAAEAPAGDRASVVWKANRYDEHSMGMGINLTVTLDRSWLDNADAEWVGKTSNRLEDACYGRIKKLKRKKSDA